MDIVSGQLSTVYIHNSLAIKALKLLLGDSSKRFL